MKETIAEKLARKSFQSAAVQKSWKAHMQAFGPILEPAFAENYQARVALTAVLNKLSNQDINGALAGLRKLRDQCATDADKAAWLFFSGVCMEFAGQKYPMLDAYRQAGLYHHKFYLPYMKVAKYAYEDRALDISVENYLLAIGCFDGDPTPADTQILASAYTNLAACYTMMHRFDEAEAALAQSQALLPNQPGRAATRAVLAAVQGNAALVEASLTQIAAETPQILEGVRSQTEQIARGEHPQYRAQPLLEEKITEFWAWMEENAQSLRGLMDTEEGLDQLFGQVQSHLLPIFPGMDQPVEFSVEPVGGCVSITLADGYSATLEAGFRTIIAACPGSLKPYLKFSIEH